MGCRVLAGRQASDHPLLPPGKNNVADKTGQKEGANDPVEAPQQANGRQNHQCSITLQGTRGDGHRKDDGREPKVEQDVGQAGAHDVAHRDAG
jgi:hypothetical protein